MAKQLSINFSEQHGLQMVIPDEEATELFKRVSDGIMAARKKGTYFSFDHPDHPFICNPDHVQSVLLMRIQDGQSNQESQTVNRQENGQASSPGQTTGQEA